MRFEVGRTSNGLLSDAPPCEGAERNGERWFIELPDLASLLAFVSKNEATIVDSTDDGGFKLEIYDDWRE